MKKIQLQFAAQALSKQQMRNIGGGTVDNDYTKCCKIGDDEGADPNCGTCDTSTKVCAMDEIWKYC